MNILLKTRDSKSILPKATKIAKENKSAQTTRFTQVHLNVRLRPLSATAVIHFNDQVIYKRNSHTLKFSMAGQ